MIKKFIKIVFLFMTILPLKSIVKLISLFTGNKKSKRILIIQLYFIGDVIIITPAIEKIKRRYPEHEIDIWLQKNSVDVLKNNPNISNIYIDPTPCTKLNSLRFFIRKIKTNLHNIFLMSQKNYEFVIDYSGYFDTAVTSVIVGRHKRIGLSIEKMLRIAYTDFLLFKFTPSSKVRRFYLDALKNIDIKPSYEDAKYQIYLTEKETQKANLLLLEKKKPITVIAPFAGWKSKEWPLENFIELAKLLTTQLPSTVFFVGGECDIKKFKGYEQYLNENIISLIGKNSLLESAALIKESNLFVGLDSSMAYIAESFDTPSILLYSSTNSNLLIENRPNVHVIHKQLNCSPQSDQLYCGDNTILYECKNDYECMQCIKVEEVATLAKKVLVQ